MEDDTKDNAPPKSEVARTTLSAADAHVPRTRELHQGGLPYFIAAHLAELERRIEWWPEKWGKNLRVLLYGDFDPLDEDCEYPSLGIMIRAGKLENTVISSARCVIEAEVSVSERSVPGLQNAIERLNTFLGAWTIIDWGNRGVGFWSYLTGPSNGGISGPFKVDGIEDVVAGIDRLNPEVRRKVRAALYWIRDPKEMLVNRFRNETLRLYAGYFNAFECLVEAVCLIVPRTKANRKQRDEAIAQFLADRQWHLDVDSVRECYKLFVDPGFVAKAKHALIVCCGDRATGYIKECFSVKPKEDQLYAVRNTINHGDVDFDSLREHIRIDQKLNRLQIIVFAMLGRIIPFKCPLDPPPSAIYGNL